MTQSQPYMNGVAAAESGRPMKASNPYQKGTVAHDRFVDAYGDETMSFDYLELSARTVSPSYHGHNVDLTTLINTLGDVVRATKRLDVIKKLLFYGPNAEKGIHAQLVNGSDAGAARSILADQIFKLDAFNEAGTPEGRAVDIIHGIIGATTETGELAEMLMNVIAGVAPFDLVNLNEESGDTKWYFAMLSRATGHSWQHDERVNIAKLATRYPDKFTDYRAHNRDTDAERATLEA